MPDSILPTGPASPEIPLTIHVSGDLEAVDFIRRLHRGGLELRTAPDGGNPVIVLAERAPQPVRGARRRLFEVGGVVHAVRAALDCSDHMEIDEVQLSSALELAGRIIDEVTEQLEGGPDNE